MRCNARASHVAVGLSPLNPVAFSENLMDVGFRQAEEIKQSGDFKAQRDLIPCGLCVGSALAWADDRLTGVWRAHHTAPR